MRRSGPRFRPSYSLAQLAYCGLMLALTKNYPFLKEQILGRCGFPTCQAMAEFHCWVYHAGVNPHSQMDDLLRTTKC